MYICFRNTMKPFGTKFGLLLLIFAFLGSSLLGRELFPCPSMTAMSCCQEKEKEDLDCHAAEPTEKSNKSDDSGCHFCEGLQPVSQSKKPFIVEFLRKNIESPLALLSSKTFPSDGEEMQVYLLGRHSGLPLHLKEDLSLLYSHLLL